MATNKNLKIKVYCDTRPPKKTYGLMTETKDGQKWVLRVAPNNWETEKAAVNWGRKHGYDVEVNGKTVKTSMRNSRKLKKETKKLIANNSKAASKTKTKKTAKRKPSPKKKK